jgi:hypothetical protein
MRSDFESLGRLRLQAILLLVVIFLIGGFTGAAFEHARLSQFARHRPPPPGGGHAFPPELRDRLHLTQEQDDRIHGILEENRPRVDEVLDRFLPRLRAVTDSVRNEVRSVLTPGQQAIFDATPMDGGQPFGGPPDRGGPPGREGSPRPRGPHPPQGRRGG